VNGPATTRVTFGSHVRPTSYIRPTISSCFVQRAFGRAHVRITPGSRFVQRAFPVQPAKKSWGKVNHPGTSHFWLTRSAHIIHSLHDHLMFRSARIRSSTRSDHARLMFGHTQLAPVGRGTGRVSTEQSASFKVAPRRQQVQGPWVCCAGIRRGGCETSLESDASPLTSTFIRRGLPC